LALVSEIGLKRYENARRKVDQTIEDGRGIKFVYQELPEDGAFISAQFAGNEVVYSIIVSGARNPLSREDVEGRFEGELLKK